jgi:hypothetical protein
MFFITKVNNLKKSLLQLGGEVELKLLKSIEKHLVLIALMVLEISEFMI